MSEQFGWSEWIEWDGGECPIPWAKAGEWQARSRTDGKGCADKFVDAYASSRRAKVFSDCWAHRKDCWPVLRYRYRLDRAPAGFVPPGAEKPWYPPVVAYCVKLEDQPTHEKVGQAQGQPDPTLARMLKHDLVGIRHGKWDRFNARQAWQKPTAAPGFMVRDVRSSDGLLTVREADHRLGGW